MFRASTGNFGRRRFLPEPIAVQMLCAVNNRPSASGNGPLQIERAEPVSIRTTRGDAPPDRCLEMGPTGDATGGSGLWNRLALASPSRFRGATQAIVPERHGIGAEFDESALKRNVLA